MKKIYFILQILFLYPIWSVGQTELFVATNGSDFNAGTIESPFRNIQKACDVAAPGTTVQILSGVYYENLVMNVSGVVDSTITFKAYQNGLVVVDGDYKNARLLEIANKDFLKIQDLQFRNANGNGSIGIVVLGSASNITIQNCEITNIGFTNDANESPNDSSNAYPFIAYGNNPNAPIKNLTFSNNRINNCRPGYSNCFELNGNVNNFKVLDNNINNNENSAIAILGHKDVCPDSEVDFVRNGTLSGNKCLLNVSSIESAAGIYLDGCKNIVVEKNTCYKNQYGIKVGCENPGFLTSLNIIRDNIIYLNYLPGFNMGNFESSESMGMVKNCSFTNNTLFRNDQDQTGFGEVVLKNTENLTFFNNIIFSTGQNIMVTAILNDTLNNSFDFNDWYNNTMQQNTTFNYNNTVYSTFAAYKSATFHELNSQFTNPGFINTSASDPNFHLLPTSPLIDAGKQSLLYNSDTDFEGNARVIDGAIDIGCFEFNSAVGINKAKEIKKSLDVWPNPSSSNIYFDHLENDLIKEIRIFNTTGNLIKIIATNASDKTTKISIEDLLDGVYFIKVTTNKNIYNSKIVKI